MGDAKPPDKPALEISTAFEALTKEQLSSLYRYAQFKAVGLRGYCSANDPMDFLQEAMLRTLNGRRKWNPQKVDFFTHLKGCIRSIANELFKQERKYVPLTEELPDRYDDEFRRWANERAEQVIHDLRTRLHGNSVALKVLRCMLEGHRPAETRRILGIQANVYNAARRHIIRRLEKITRHD
jgi:DNA-directed RNA polymerase specialized sigma24 family protein